MNEVLLAIEIPRTFEVGCVIGFFAGMIFIGCNIVYKIIKIARWGK